ncbi:PEP/pyruvate-binding domain-containing protein [Bradyrhizobium murdochi]|uniref:PEP/pyruvate-binding domain-containing protein n=1 Tax=Bradyrhizobium murdochi TaxID=1038859 RepID=UPI0003F7B5E9|nr:PEP/pyruvate-binding domain-containing protein [Bradyrhizobium murdochi]
MTELNHLVRLEDCADEPIRRVGHKAALLGWAQKEGLQTAGGWVLPADLFWAAMQAAKVASQVRYLEENALRLDPQHTRQLAGAIRGALAGDVLEEFARIDAAAAHDRLDTPRLVCRSSAAMEDGRVAAFPGVFASSLDLTSPRSLAKAIVDCWRSVFSPVAIDYLLRMRAEPVDFSIAILIQRQIAATWYGLYVSADPITGVPLPRAELTDVAPDALVGGKSATLQARYEAGCWSGAEAADGVDDALEILRRWSTKLEERLHSEVDIEFAIPTQGSPLLLQCRPLTGKTPARDLDVQRGAGQNRIFGRPCAGGNVIGFAIDGPLPTGKARKRIAVIDRIGADSYDLVFGYDGVIVEQDVSPLSHVAILCREVGVPLISGIADARALLKGRWVAVDGAGGYVEMVARPVPDISVASLDIAVEPTLTTLELLLRVLAEARPGQDIAAERDRIARVYSRALGGRGLHLTEAYASDSEYDRLDRIGAELFGAEFSSQATLATWNQSISLRLAPPGNV